VTIKATQRSRGIARLAAASSTLIDSSELRGTGLPLEDPELIAEDEDLEILGAVVLATGAEETGENPDH
jgi:hypothetical protein